MNNNTSYYLQTDSSSYMYRVTCAADIRSPIFYDSDNTGYYCDPNGTNSFYQTYTNISQYGSSGNWNQDFYNAPPGTYRYGGDVGANGSSNPGGSWWMQQNFRHTNGNNYWGTQIAWGWEDNANRLAQRNISGGNWSGWVYYLNSGNYTSYNSYGSLYANILYDNNDTGYYCDPNSTSNFSTLNCQATSNFLATVPAIMYGQGNTSSASAVGMYVYSGNGSGAIFSFHRGGYYAVNMGLDSDNVIRIGGWSAAGSRWQLDMSGNMYAAGNITAYSSDIRLKENIITIDNAIDKVKQLRGVYYDWKPIVDSLGFNPIDRHDIGVIAQEVGEVIPQAVKPAPFDTGLNNMSVSGENYVTVQMEKIIPLLIEAIKELNLKVEKLEAKNGN
jgi:hypothetical protein